MTKSSVTAKRRPAGRPRTFDQDEALEIAMQMFWRSGFAATSVGDLADAMSMQRSSFYNAFGSREGVFAAALQRYASGLPDRALERISPDEAVGPSLVAMFREICRLRASDPEARGCMMVNAMSELIGVNSVLGPELARALEERLVLISRLLRQAAARGELRELPDSEACARSFVAFLSGLNLLSKVVRAEAELWETCRTFLVNLGFVVAPERAKRGASSQSSSIRGVRVP